MRCIVPQQRGTEADTYMYRGMIQHYMASKYVNSKVLEALLYRTHTTQPSYYWK